MKIAVRYCSRTGNTKKLATAIADALGVEALEVSVPLTEKVDVLFLGSAVYAAGVDEAIPAFLRANAGRIGRVVNFNTAALLSSTYKQVKRLADKSGIDMAAEEFHCRGAFSVMHRNRPNENDLQKAVSFAKDIVKKARKD